jgi:nucleoside-diphosphate-sugar epimerase
MAKALVTGATGFIGSKLTERLLADGNDVTCLVRDPARAQALRALGVRLALGDVRDPDAMLAAVDGADVVYHLAGMVRAFRSDEMMETNARAFRNVADACAQCTTPPRLIFVSSLAAAGPSPAGRPRVESDPPAPVSNYGRTKRAAELIAEEYAARIPITIVRPPIVFGEGDQNMLAVFRSIFRLGIHLALGVAYSRYSLIHVSDPTHRPAATTSWPATSSRRLPSWAR